MDRAKKCHVFGGHFNQKSLARTQTCDRQISQISVLSSGDMTMRVFIRNIAGGDSIIARCIIFGVLRLPVRPCDERPPAMYGHFCLVPRVCLKLQCAEGREFEPRPGQYSRMSFSSDQVTGTVFPHLNMPFLPNSEFIYNIVLVVKR